MSRPAVYTSVFVLYTYFFSACAAAAAEPQPDPVPDGGVVQISERQPDLIYSYGYRTRDALDVGSAVTVITAEEIDERQYAFVADALKASPGVALARNGAFGGFASARIRGGSSGQTLVVIDGVIVNDPSAPQGGFNFANLDVADIEQIEVLRGPQSLVWGADAIDGVVSIRTKNSAAPASFILEGGSRGTARGGATLSGAWGDAYARATFSGVTSNGISRAANGIESDAYRSLAASFTGGAALSSNADIGLNARVSDSRAGIDGFPPPAFVFADTPEVEDTTDYAVSARLDHRSGERYQGALTLAAASVDRRDTDLGAETFAATGDRLTANYWGAMTLTPSLSLEAGAKAERTAAKVSGVDDHAVSGAVFALAEFRPVKSLVLSAGARRDEFSNFKGATTARVAGVLAISEKADSATRLRASWGEGFRAPTLFELNFDQFGVTPNPDLRPERASGFDAGVEAEIGKILLRATYFRQRVKDQIDFDFAGSGYFNIDRVKSRGVEVEAEWSLSDIFEASLAYSFIDAKDQLTGLAILRTPKHSGSATFVVRPTPAFSVSSTVAFNGRESDFPAPNRSFVTLDIRAAYAISEALELYGRVENATDSDYQDVSGFGEPGASAFAGVRVRL
ncbi:MAG: TonB-dependent receptor [Pseudomonadota bacterium]